MVVTVLPRPKGLSRFDPTDIDMEISRRDGSPEHRR